MPRKNKSPFLPRFFAGCAYFFCMLQWLWVVILLLPALIDSGVLESFTPPPAEPVQTEIRDAGSSSPILLAVGGIVTIFMLIITVVLLIKFPVKVAQTGSNVVYKTSEALLPIVTHHHPIGVKKRRILTERLVIFVKLGIILLPVLACFILPTNQAIQRELILFIGALLAMLSLGLFLLEYVVQLMYSRRKKT